MTGINQDHIEGFSVKREFISTHIQTINISDLNVKLLQIYFKLRYIEFYNGIVNIDAKKIHSMIHKRHHALRCHTQ
jgi:hypothetical protein